jgi:hypothetical protein
MTASNRLKYGATVPNVGRQSVSFGQSSQLRQNRDGYDLHRGGSAMEIQEALKIMRALASGVNPETGESMEADSVYRQPDTVRALNRALAALVQLEQRERNKPTNAGRKWTRAEDAQVCDEVRNGVDFHEVAKKHNRTVGSIVARLVKLGKIAAPPPKAA